jgi:hypothetical protein
MSPDCVDPWDWSRSYLLPENVRSNIPLRGSVGSLGAHNAARGLVVEICHATAAVPVALHYTEPSERVGQPRSARTLSRSRPLGGARTPAVPADPTPAH